jgi:hypothetical protein
VKLASDHLEDSNDGKEKVDTMNHSGGLKAIETTIAYGEKQREATASDILVFRNWRGLTLEKGRRLSSKWPRPLSLKNELSFRNSRRVNTIICEIWAI